MNHVQQSFNRAATSYDAVGTLQHQVAQTLSQFVRTELPAGFSGKLLDAGCGTGYCLKHLHSTYPSAQFLALDFAAAMLHQRPAALGIPGIQADIHRLPIASGSINTYLSSLAWQWCNPAIAAQEAARVLTPEGNLFVATLVDGTFNELARSLNACDINPDDHLLRCSPIDTIRNALTPAGLEIQSFTAQQITTWHPDFKTLRRTIRGVGANHLPTDSTPPFNRQSRAQLINAYESLRTEQGLPLSYEVLIIHARKP